MLQEGLNKSFSIEGFNIEINRMVQWVESWRSKLFSRKVLPVQESLPENPPQYQDPEEVIDPFIGSNLFSEGKIFRNETEAGIILEIALNTGRLNEFIKNGLQRRGVKISGKKVWKDFYGKQKLDELYKLARAMKEFTPLAQLLALRELLEERLRKQVLEEGLRKEVDPNSNSHAKQTLTLVESRPSDL